MKISPPKGGKVLKNLTPEGGKVLRKWSGKGPYVLRTDTPTLPQIRFWIREIMAMLYIASRRDLLNLAIRFQRDPPLRI